MDLWLQTGTVQQKDLLFTVGTVPSEYCVAAGTAIFSTQLNNFQAFSVHSVYLFVLPNQDEVGQPCGVLTLSACM